MSMPALLLQLAQNIALLVALSVVYQILSRRRWPSSLAFRLVAGAVFGAVGVVGMMTPVHLLPGIIFDGRSIILAVSGVVGGGVVAAAAAALCVAVRLAVGGDGALMGILVIASSALLGVGFGALRRRDRRLQGLAPLWGLGLVVHLVMLACTLALPRAVAGAVLQNIALPVLLVYPLATMVVCRLFLDLEDQESALEALRESEERLRRAVVEAPVPTMLHAEGGEVLELSRSWCEQSGYSREEIFSLPAWLALAGGARAATEEAGTDRLFDLDRRADDGCFELRTKSGASRAWALSSAPLGRLPDARRLLISTATDVTESRRKEEELEQRVAARTAQLEAVNRELEAFSYSVSHDLRAPVRAVDGFAQLLVDEHGAELSAEARRMLEVIRGEARRMGNLIDDLLALSRSGRQAVRPEVFDHSSLVREVFDEIARRAPERALELRLGELPRAPADPSLLRQVWVNLLDNAVKFTRSRERAEIEVGGSVAPGEAHYFVRDNGCGFDPRYADRLFGVFHRLHRAEEFEGTGVGLALARRIVERHGGRIWAEAEVDSGARFSFALPLVASVPALAVGGERPGESS